ncbi:hypothetical protein NP493_53g20024 [Ridgeia piscesae]|uniref:Uncharacterized protein n=1 Tax=Ridgeia piscesae TaxID=27915 RepID=A0AAD9UJF3_RIDPI|nr:hypothetical protein NP493_53g20024 [Ridgeia piscesae]
MTHWMHGSFFLPSCIPSPLKKRRFNSGEDRSKPRRGSCVQWRHQAITAEPLGKLNTRMVIDPHNLYAGTKEAASFRSNTSGNVRLCPPTQ